MTEMPFLILQVNFYTSNDFCDWRLLKRISQLSFLTLTSNKIFTDLVRFCLILQEEQASTFDAGDNAHLLYITLTLNDIVKKLDNMQKPCHESSNSAMDERITKIEEAVNRLTSDMSSRYHELRVDVNDNQETANTKQRELKQSVEDLKQSVNQNAAKRAGTTYVRWGRTTCPSGVDAVYTGYAGGSWFDHPGGAVSMLCLPKNPDWAKYIDGVGANSGFVYGAEYEPADGRTDQFFGNGHSQHDVPCTVCNAKSRSSSIMVPGMKMCPADWSLEYTGYLMSGRYNHKSSSDYYCIDAAAESLPGGFENKNGYLLFFVESRCGSLACPPYVEGREMTCAVCSK